MDSTGDDELAADLAELTAQLRAQLTRHASLGAWAGSARPTTRSARPAVDPANEPAAHPDPAADLGPLASVPLASHPGIVLPATGESSESTAPSPSPSPSPARSGRSLAQIREELGACTRCKLHTTRTNIVFGVGSEQSPLMFIGEAPGEQEDLRGEPFVGRAGELLDKMIEAMGWTRQTVYIANVLKSRPPGNRNPQPDEVTACSPFLDEQIRAIAPRIIVTLGRPAANHVLRSDAPIGTLRGRFHDRDGIAVMPTFHPAYLLRDPEKKKDTWSDLKQVIAELARLGVEPPHPSRG
ncbi:MAG: uracil-DNA glycosylase [Myxococcota bacterium]|nr:uracil-DNA glycosylase [Myxococcota bacterium]